MADKRRKPCEQTANRRQEIGDIYEKERRRNRAQRPYTSFEFGAGDSSSQYLLCLCGMPATTSIRVLSCWEMSDQRRHDDIEGHFTYQEVVPKPEDNATLSRLPRPTPAWHQGRPSCGVDSTKAVPAAVLPAPLASQDLVPFGVPWT
jgi:hypothetical protein